ncbi:MAG: hypothetical protein F2772_01680 [Actinobacteria bacterium]|uniref:Unannotated protein n=2 Tax=freshwater metagenome TaxID=449393 RepID=A0A6J6PX60_9ZZZZ|nr:hypothetical protein [Actinomycetota bacterium]MSW77653.1 hypothetical protein [Actinomycetota bacterium]MSX54215.1 hypothetical protein [Actinomycetota bacterium]MSX94340.1 hypothetical protein [Actinomycetota bacterium]MTB18286.1 hypothetical protein [Actinomycetota bacterium]
MPLRVLIVCTANVCRSPMAAALLSQHGTNIGVELQVRSAGTHADTMAVDPLAVSTMSSLGLDISRHIPRALSRQIIDDDGADLVLTMCREHLRVVATTAPGSFRRTFTVKEFARRLVSADVVQGDILAVKLALVGEGRNARDLLGDSPADDVADPYGLSLEQHHTCATELDALMRTIATNLG